MTKSRTRKRRPASRRGERRPGTSRQGESDRESDLRSFTMRGWAVAAQVLRQRRDRQVVLDLMGYYDWLGDSNLDAIVRRLPPLPCRAGCAYCCYVGPDRPDVLPSELLRIVVHLRQEGSRTALKEVEARLRDSAYGAQGEKPPCLFLSEEQCQIYPVRPMRCRAQHSHDRYACERHYLGQQATMPLIRQPALLFKSLQIGMRMGLHEAGLRDARLALSGALRLALLEQPDALERWLDGEAVFAAVELPEEADEGQFLIQLRRQARGQVRAEARALRGTISTLLEQGGEWARYSTTGQIPAAGNLVPERLDRG